MSPWLVDFVQSWKFWCSIPVSTRDNLALICHLMDVRFNCPDTHKVCRLSSLANSQFITRRKHQRLVHLWVILSEPSNLNHGFVYLDWSLDQSSVLRITVSLAAPFIMHGNPKCSIAGLYIICRACVFMQASGPSSAASATKPSTRRAPCRSTWSNTLERSPSSVRCATSGSPRRATWNTTWRDPMATVSTWPASRQHTHRLTNDSNHLCQPSSLSLRRCSSKSTSLESVLLWTPPFPFVMCVCASMSLMAITHSLHLPYSRHYDCKALCIKRCPWALQTAERRCLPSPVERFNHLSSSFASAALHLMILLIICWEWALCKGSPPPHSPIMCMHAHAPPVLQTLWYHKAGKPWWQVLRLPLSHQQMHVLSVKSLLLPRSHASDFGPPLFNLQTFQTKLCR